MNLYEKFSWRLCFYICSEFKWVKNRRERETEREKHLFCLLCFQPICYRFLFRFKLFFVLVFPLSCEVKSFAFLFLSGCHTRIFQAISFNQSKFSQLWAFPFPSESTLISRLFLGRIEGVELYRRLKFATFVCSKIYHQVCLCLQASLCVEYHLIIKFQFEDGFFNHLFFNKSHKTTSKKVCNWISINPPKISLESIQKISLVCLFLSLQNKTLACIFLLLIEIQIAPQYIGNSVERWNNVDWPNKHEESSLIKLSQILCVRTITYCLLALKVFVNLR